jgi:hypothetical protein
MQPLFLSILRLYKTDRMCYNNTMYLQTKPEAMRIPKERKKHYDE